MQETPELYGEDGNAIEHVCLPSICPQFKIREHI